MNSKTPDFKLDAPPEFSAKIASIFAQLGDIEKKRNESLQSRDHGASNVQKEDPAVLRDEEFAIPRSKLQLDRRNSFSPSASACLRRKPPFEFRRPKIPPPSRPRVPDHKLHPEKWTKYSLASVDDSHMSDGANTAAALAYLRQQERKSQGQALWDEDAQLLDLRAKVMFHGKKKTNERLRPKFLLSDQPGASDMQQQNNEAGADTNRTNFGTKVRTLVEKRANDNRKIALSHLQDMDDGDGDDVEMKSDENASKSAADRISDQGCSDANSDGKPKPKKFKRAVRQRSETDHPSEDVVPAGDEEAHKGC
ncbi:uncharacterized protein LOC100901783 [Galendromus occidentalis]|uniref:U5 small nuclear ribonucleoprotein TSSC4 n=1 Tax=Galendromus occidentalis TaxID=34638 RepID=A0AAJ6QVV1_9ACAR|nr:uncharacterized protein LOC100901783 [Galendromus occidentalis]